MEDNPAIDPSDEVPRPEVGQTGRGGVPHTANTHPQSSLSSPGRHPGHDGSPVLQVQTPGAGEAPGSVHLTSLQSEVEFLRTSGPASHTALTKIRLGKYHLNTL